VVDALDHLLEPVLDPVEGRFVAAGRGYVFAEQALGGGERQGAVGGDDLVDALFSVGSSLVT
jgi:hypothetical protein